MRVISFDTKKGLFHFEIENIQSSFHQHPTHEFIYSHSGFFTLETQNRVYQNINFASIPKNTEHKVYSESSKLEIIMIEEYSSLFSTIFYRAFQFSTLEISTSVDGRNTIPQPSGTMSLLVNCDLKRTEDDRINKIIEFLESNLVEPNSLLLSLTELVHLSKSRLSHLFKDTMGISLKNYLLWTKLKHAIESNLKEGHNLTEISYISGFSDQAHFSKTFRKFLGVAPSLPYNSSTIQVFPSL